MALTRDELQKYHKMAGGYLQRAGVAITPTEAENIEIVDLGLNDFERIGLSLVTYVNTERYCAKELVMLPGQTCPEHVHPPIPEHDYPGKEETFRCRWGQVYLYVNGEPTVSPHAQPPQERRDTYTVWHEIVLNPGEQYTIPPGTWHWFQGGPDGAVVPEFSSTS